MNNDVLLIKEIYYTYLSNFILNEIHIASNFKIDQSYSYISSEDIIFLLKLYLVQN